ncbi:MAG: homoserine O-acetyltransferase [Gammaproteobacteria bacterium]|nr:MAG: homoserine O-acetyltransferase [Gammaproteobacteria bacterium]UCH39018.1 MAG: homoserine O-acetyltransferase [Gammaproteobacteria bacterium]
MADEENAYSFTTAATRHIKLECLPEGGMKLWRGERLPEVTLAYESWGELNEKADNAIIIFTGLSPSAHAASSPQDPSPGWWEYMIGPGKAVDTNRFFVVCANSLGGCYGSTGPSSINPATGSSYDADFPDVTVEDIASSGYYLMRELGVEKLHAAVGSSMGGMSSIAYAMQYPGEIRYLVSISAAAQALPLTIALRSLQREIIRSDPDWNNGHYSDEKRPLSGMSLARKLGLVSYRAADEWNSKFDRSRLPPEKLTGQRFEREFEIENYLEYNAQKFIHSFDPNSYLYLSRAMDWFDIAEHGDSIAGGMAKIDVEKALVVGVTTDILFPLRQQREIADVMRSTGTDVDYVEIDSVNGHDAFLIDDEHFSPVVKKFLDESVS